MEKTRVSEGPADENWTGRTLTSCGTPGGETAKARCKGSRFENSKPPVGRVRSPSGEKERCKVRQPAEWRNRKQGENRGRRARRKERRGKQGEERKGVVANGCCDVGW